MTSENNTDLGNRSWSDLSEMERLTIIDRVTSRMDSLHVSNTYRPSPKLLEDLAQRVQEDAIFLQRLRSWAKKT